MTNPTNSTPADCKCVNGIPDGARISDCPNMRGKENDTSLRYEHYECKVCGDTDFLDYEEMR